KTQAPAAPAPAPPTSFASQSPFAPEPKPAPTPDFATGAFQSRDDVFATPGTPPSSPAMDMPPAGGGETRAFPRMTFEDLPPVTPAPAPAASSPWDEPAPSTGETRAFPKMSFE